MNIDNYSLAINIVVALVSLFPLIFVIYQYKAYPPKYYGLLMWGIVLVVWASVTFGWLSEAIFKISGPETNGVIEQGLKQRVLSNLQIWVYVVPAVTAAVGANLISAYLIRNKPQENA